MQYINLGNTGLKVSSLCLGCMTYGEPDRPPHPWTLDEEQSRPILKQAVDAGINFFDTANQYSSGSSEEIVGRALKEYTRRDEVVIATKAFFKWGEAPNAGGLSRKALFHAIDDSLARLGTDYVDLFQIHRMDHHTPIEETLEALHDIVKAGKARYIGASSMYAWEFMKALHISKTNGWTQFISMQNHLNLLYREEEREMLPLCRDQNIAVIPWSPLARGRLTRDWDEQTERTQTDEFGKYLFSKAFDSDKQIVDAVGRLADARGVPRAQIALAWVIAKTGVTAPIIGASKPGHLDDALAAMELELSEEEIAELEKNYVPHPILGH